MRSIHSYNAANEMHTEVKQHLLELVNFMTPTWEKRKRKVYAARRFNHTMPFPSKEGV